MTPAARVGRRAGDTVSDPFYPSDDPFRCRCERWQDNDCMGRATQKDMRCNICRDGCGLAMLGQGQSMHVGTPSRMTHLLTTLYPAGELVYSLCRCGIGSDHSEYARPPGESPHEPASPYELWRQAGGGTGQYDREKYHDLMVAHGLILRPGDESYEDAGVNPP